MIPSLFIRLGAFPLTPNGKIDRKALRRLDTGTTAEERRIVAPSNEVERLLLEIWEEFLPVRPLSVQEDFFDLGGHSLLAARVFAQIERRLGKKLPLAILFESPTIEGIARALRSTPSGSHWPLIAPMRTEGTRPPLFLVHGAEGNVLLYRSLLRYLDDDQPVYGLQSGGLDGERNFNPSILTMATKYLEEVRSVQPRGPYLLGGYCMGGTVALEMAQQLREAGEQVALLALFETYNVQSVGSRRGILASIVGLAQNLAFHALGTLSIASADRRLFLEQKLETELTRLRIALEVHVERIKAIFTGNVRGALSSRANQQRQRQGFGEIHSAFIRRENNTLQAEAFLRRVPGPTLRLANNTLRWVSDACPSRLPPVNARGAVCAHSGQ